MTKMISLNQIKSIVFKTTLASLAIIAFAVSTGHAAAPGSSTASSDSGDGFVNVRVSPLGLLIGYFNFDFDFKISDQWSLGPTVTYWSYNYDSSLFAGNQLKVETTAIGARATWSRNGTFKTGLYVSPIIQFVSAKASGVSSTTGATVTGTGHAPILSGIVGYQWWFDSFMINVGAGLAVGASSSKVEVNDGVNSSSAESTRTSGLALDAMIGYTF